MGAPLTAGDTDRPVRMANILDSRGKALNDTSGKPTNWFSYKKETKVNASSSTRRREK